MGRQIAIFGNGELGAAAALAYDADLVIRFNDCRSAGETADRTDIVAVCNTGRPAKILGDDQAWRSSPAMRAASALWCVRNPERFAEMRAPLAESHPELDDFCDDYTETFREIAADNGKQFHVIPRSVHDRLDEAFAGLTDVPYASPSTGILVIEEVIANHLVDGDRILLAGFFHEGWDGHPWDAERKYIQPFEAKGLIERAYATNPDERVSGARG